MPLTSNREVVSFASQALIDLAMDDNVVIYKGALVGRNRSTGYARALVAGDEFLGLAYAKADNTISGHTAGGVDVRLHQGIDVVHALASVATGDIGKDVYASDDSTLTLTPTGNSRIGRIVAVEGTNLARVRLQPAMHLGGALENEPVVTLADANATLTLDHVNRVLLIGNTAARTLTLPAVASVRAGGTIDGATTLATLDAQYDCAHLLCTGSEWIVLSRDIA